MRKRGKEGEGGGGRCPDLLQWQIEYTNESKDLLSLIILRMRVFRYAGYSREVSYYAWHLKMVSW